MRWQNMGIKGRIYHEERCHTPLGYATITWSADDDNPYYTVKIEGFFSEQFTRSGLTPDERLILAKEIVTNYLLEKQKEILDFLLTPLNS